MNTKGNHFLSQFLSLLSALFIGFSTLTAAQQASYAGEIENVIYQTEAPTDSDLARWEKLPGTRRYTFNVPSFTPIQLQRLKKLPGVTSLKIITETYPSDSNEAEWKALTSLNLEVSIRGFSLPSEAAIERLNRILFKKLEVFAPLYPVRSECALISTIQVAEGGLLSLRFPNSRFPMPNEIDELTPLRADIQMHFVVDYWPSQSHADLLNLYPNPIQITVNNIFPQTTQFEYLRNMEHLRRVEIFSDFDPMNSAMWDEFDTIPVRWTKNDSVPQMVTLQGMANAQKRLGNLREMVLVPSSGLTSSEIKKIKSVADLKVILLQNN